MNNVEIKNRLSWNVCAENLKGSSSDPEMWWADVAVKGLLSWQWWITKDLNSGMYKLSFLDNDENTIEIGSCSTLENAKISAESYHEAYLNMLKHELFS